jgi:hypothetical protein
MTADYAPAVGDVITDYRDDEWTLIERQGPQLTIGRQAARGWYQQTASVCMFPRYAWDHCPTCGDRATAIAAGVPSFHGWEPCPQSGNGGTDGE